MSDSGVAAAAVGNGGGRVRRWGRRALIAVGALAALLALAWAAVPPLVRHLAQTQASEALGRPVTVGAVDFRPWALALTVDDLQIGPAPGAPGGAEPLLRIGRLAVDTDLRSIWHRAPVIESLSIERPQVRVTRLAAGRYDIDDLIARFAKPSPQPPADDAPPRWALYNLNVGDGRLVFDDRPAGRVHTVDALRVDLPFLSSLPADVAVRVQPRLAFTLNGSPFDSGARATPFSADRASDLSLRTGDIDLAPWLPYLPAGLPLAPTAGRVGADLEVAFSMPPGGQARVAVRGRLRATDVALRDADGGPEPRLGWQRLTVDVDELLPLERSVRLGEVALTGLHGRAERRADGRLGFPGQSASTGAPAAAPPPPAASAPAAAPAGGWRLALRQFTLTDARWRWDDATTQPRAALSLAPVSATLSALSWPLSGPATFALDARLRGGADASVEAGGLKLAGRVVPTPSAAASAASSATPSPGDAAAPQVEATASVDALDLAALHPYLQTVLVPRLDGRVTAELEVTHRPGDDTRFGLPMLRVDTLRLGAPAAAGRAPRTDDPMPSVGRLEVAGVRGSLQRRQLTVERVVVTRPALTLARAADGGLNAAAWLRTDPAAPSALPPATPAAAAGPDWSVRLDNLQLADGRVGWRDAALPAGQAPVALEVDRLRIGLKGLQWPARAGATAGLTLAARLAVAAGSEATGGAAPAAATLDWTGQLGLGPLSLRGRLAAERLPLHLADAYLADRLPVDLLRALGGYRGEVALSLPPEGPKVDLRGDARLTDLQVHARGADGGGEELLSWQALEVPALQVRLAPGQPLAVETGEVRLSDFYARLVVTEQGRFNLADVAGNPVNAPEASASGPTAAAPPAAASAPAPAAAASAPTSPPPTIAVAGVVLANGRVDFSDRFIRPNYSAALTELNGRLGAFRSGTPQMATLELRGRAAGTALLEVRGSLNPTAQPLALDIQARASDLELAPLSPYAGKYAGYAIERGKLTMDVKYNIQPDGKLAASNQVILNQLTFGERIESKDATSLPVRLAVALLTDRNGVIDINLPISGSINDPQFSVGGLIVKVIVNLLVKAVTAPFSLFAGGSEDLSVVEFSPGTAALAPSAGAVIDKVAKSLTERPALQMTVTGAADPAGERQAMQRAALDARLAAEARREALRAGQPVPADAAASGVAPSAPPPVPTGAERDRLLKRVYDDTKLPDKPRNLIGLTKDLPPAEMEARLLAATPVNTDTARELALQRGLAVRDALIARGLPSERLFLAAPKLRASGEGDADWSPRVQLTLATR